MNDDQRQQVTAPEISSAPQLKQHEQTTEFTAAPPKRHRHGHGIQQTLHQIDRSLDNSDEKRRAMSDYNETQRKIRQEQWRMQHRDDFDM